MKRVLATLTLTLALPAPAHASEVREVCAKSTYLTLRPGKIFTGTLTEHQTIRVTRYSGAYAYGFARGHINRKGWVKTADLCT
jgi:hypothetical protein